LRARDREGKVLQGKETDKLERFLLGDSLGSRKHYIMRIMRAERS